MDVRSRTGSRLLGAAVALVAVAGVIAFAGCSDDKESTPEPAATATTAAETPAATEPADTTPITNGPPPIDGEVTETASGLKIIESETVPGAAVAETGKTVAVEYSLWLEDGTLIDSSVGTEPYSFTLGADPPEVIPAWDEGILGMTLGSKRRLIVPPDLGYGAIGYPPDIPPNAVLTFDVRLVGVE